MTIPDPDRFSGSLFGLAAGDAVGMAVEFRSPGSFPPLRDMSGGEPFRLSSTDRCFDIGNTVRSALESFERTGQAFSGPTGARTAGNGSLMRLAPPRAPSGASTSFSTETGSWRLWFFQCTTGWRWR